MDSDSWLLFFALILLILGGGYFAAAETAFVSSSGTRIKSRANDGDKHAQNALYILGNFDQALSTILVGNNIMHIGAASISTLLVTRLWGAGVVAYTTIAVTIVVFLVSEMLPKSFASHKAEQVAYALAGSLRFLMRALVPVSAFFGLFGKLFSKAFGEVSIPTVTEDELYDIIESAAEDGIMDKNRSRLLYSALEFDDTTVQEILTARIYVVGIDIDMSCEEIIEIIKKNKYTRLPVYEGTIDNIIGILSVPSFIKEYLKQGDRLLTRELMHKPYFVPKSKGIDDLFREMSGNRLHMAVVTDDYGGAMGIVTMEDILEELVGEIWDENDVVREDFKVLADGRYEVSGDMSFLDALDRMDLGNSEFCEDAKAKTTGAWAQENINSIPRQGSSFSLGRLTATVLQIDSRQHITKMLFVIRKEEATSTGRYASDQKTMKSGGYD